MARCSIAHCAALAGVFLLLASAGVRADDLDSYKVLNNLLSVAISNIYVDGQFKSIYSLSSTQRILPPGTCARSTFTWNGERSGVIKQIVERGTLRIGVTTFVVSAGSPYYNTATTPPSGFFADLGLMVTNTLGLILGADITPEFVVIPNTAGFFTDITAALNRGNVDTVIGTSWIKTRTRAVDFTCWYEAPSPIAIYKDPAQAPPAVVGSNFNTMSAWNKAGVRVATLTGSIFEDAANTFLPLATKVQFTSLQACYDSVGKTSDIVIAIVGEVTRELELLEGTKTIAGGANAFTTRRVPASS